MRRSQSQSLDEILGGFLREEGLETPLNQHRIVSAWPKVLGEGINQERPYDGAPEHCAKTQRVRQCAGYYFHCVYVGMEFRWCL
jgi:hypothetical protein